MNFNELKWHDSSIKGITIDRNSPGLNDIIKFEMDWIDIGKGELIFEGVYWVSFNLNFGIVAEESILRAFVVSENDPDLSLLYKRWNRMIDNVKLNSYTIELNSTGSRIKIISESYKVK